MGIYGQDWSSYQDAAPDTSGLSFAFVKVTEGLSYVNPLWRSQRDHARANGLVVGYYHYPHMGNSPQAEADHFLSQVDWQPGDIIVLDWEGYDSANAGVSHSAQMAYKEAWLSYVKSKMPNFRVGMYCNVDYWNNVDTSGNAGDFLWIATAGRGAGDPGIRASWLFHQYSDSPVDSDYCNLGSIDELRSWAGAQLQGDELAFSEDDLRRFMREEGSGQVVRDAVAYAVFWWLNAALSGNFPAGIPQDWTNMLQTAHDNLASGSVAEAVWAHPLADPTNVDASGQPKQIPASAFQVDQDRKFDDLMAAIKAIPAGPSGAPADPQAALKVFSDWLAHASVSVAVVPPKA
jgi:hypothetical protein